MSSQSSRGGQAFHHYYSQLFPDPQEFAQFILSLRHSNLPILRFHPDHREQLQNLWQQASLDWQTLPWYPSAVLWPQGVPMGTSLPGYAEKRLYPMNPSSLLPPLTLNPQPGDLVLDACAAPGGKTLVMWQQMQGRGQLIANDVSRNRCQLMKGIFHDYQASDITIFNHSAQNLDLQFPQVFDKILLDAPCSSEKHVYRSRPHLQQWSPARIKHLRRRQLQLLSGLLKALKPGGLLVYSTCAITPEENELVIAEFLAKHSQEVTQISGDFPSAAPRQSGFSLPSTGTFDPNLVHRILPHRQPGFDPMFIATLQKQPSSK